MPDRSSQRAPARRLAVRWATAGIALTLAAFGCGSPALEGPPPIIVYLVDTLRADHLPVYGYARDTAPRLSEFARDAVVFEQAYAPTSWTKPSTASLLTGLDPLHHGVSYRTQGIDDDIELLPEALARAGYHTAAFVTNPWISSRWGFDQGFDSFHPRFEQSDAETLVDAALAHLETRRDRPFFLYLHALDPHSPYESRPGFQPWSEARAQALRSRDLRPDNRDAVVAAYDAEIRYGDHHFGRFLDALDEWGLYERSVIVFTSDHGEEFLEHGGSDHGRTLHEELVRVPLLIKLPGEPGAGRRAQSAVSLVDVVPTLHALAGVTASGVLDGDDLARVMAPDPDEPTARRIFLELDLLHDGEWNRARAVREGPLKLIEVERPEPQVLLFDLADDPGEQVDRAAGSPGEIARLGALLAARGTTAAAGFHMAVVNRPGPRITRFEGSLRAPSGQLRITALDQLEEGDHAEISDDGQRLRFAFTGQNVDDPKDRHRYWQIDEDWIRFDVDPPGSAVEFESFEISEGAPRIHLGPERELAPGLPLRFAADDERIGISDPALLLPRSGKRTVWGKAGVYLAAVPHGEQRSLSDLDPAEREQLRKLGYVAD